MTLLRHALGEYLTLRRALGYKLARSEKLLGQFISYLEESGTSSVTVDDAIAWATLPAASQVWSRKRLTVIRGFALYLHTLDERCEVPPTDAVPGRGRRAVPYLYSDEQLAALLDATSMIRSPLRAATFRTLIGLLAVTGVRIGEAIATDRADLDLEAAVLTIRHGKNGKCRLLPLHPSTAEALAIYLKRPDRPRWSTCTALFISTTGTRLLYKNVVRTFRQLVRRAGLAHRTPSCRPRIHDLRHTFAVQTVIDCYRSGVDVDVRMPILSTYLGHVDPANTYWYLTGSPELLALAGQRLEAALGESA